MTLHIKEAEQERSAVEARRQDEMVTCWETTAARHRSNGKMLGCFGLPIKAHA